MDVVVPETTNIENSARMRPRVERELPIDAKRVLSRIGTSLGEISCRCVGSVMDRHVALHIKNEHRHFWSPWFSGQVDPSGSERSVLHGRFGPSPAIWTFFAACYAVFVFGGIAGLMYGISQWMVGQHPWALWLTPAFAVGVFALYLIARVGRRLAAEQIGWMLQLLDCSLDGHLSCAKARCAACPLWSGHEEAAAALPQRVPAMRAELHPAAEHQLQA
jgi:hypothetical protein